MMRLNNGASKDTRYDPITDVRLRAERWSSARQKDTPMRKFYFACSENGHVAPLRPTSVISNCARLMRAVKLEPAVCVEASSVAQAERIFLEHGAGNPFLRKIQCQHEGYRFSLICRNAPSPEDSHASSH
jgi:hypothetical protein